MENALLNYARVIRKCLKIPVAGLRGGAAAGGLGAGLAAFFRAGLENGAAFVLEKTGFESELARSALLITGEGRFDEQTFYGKAPGAALAAAQRLGKPALVVCGDSAVRSRAELRRRGVLGVIRTGVSRDPAAAIVSAVERGLPAILARLRNLHAPK